MKQFKKIIMTIAILFTTFMFGNSDVVALSGGTDAGGVGSNTGSPGTTQITQKNWWSGMTGIRISFVNSSGNQLGHSIDYLPTNVFNKNWNVHYLDNITKTAASNKVTYSKMGYSGSNLKFSSSTKKLQVDSFAYVKKSSDLKTSLSWVSGFSGKLDNALNNRNYAGLFQPIIDELKSNKNDLENFWNFLQQFGITYNNISQDPVSGMYDIFMVYEPISIVTINGEFYYGSFHEMAIFSKTKGHNRTDALTNGCTTALCDFIKTGGFRYEACSVYLTGSLESQLKEQLKTNKVNGITFTKGSYFGKLIGIDSTIERASNGYGRCSKANDYNVTENDVSSYTNLGLGVLWIGDLFINVDCTVIEKALPNLKDTLDNIYFNNKYSFYKQGYNGINVNVNNGKISNGNIYYKNESGIEKTVPLNWFVNECTCLGIYDYYDKTNLPSYYSKYQNELSKVQFDQKNVQLYNTVDWLIEKKLVPGQNLYDNYNDYIKTINSSLQLSNDKDIKKLSVTTWTKEKYFGEPLKCGSGQTRGQTLWCDDVEKFYNKNNKSGASVSLLKSKSRETIINVYGEELKTLLDIYNKLYYPATGYKWHLTDSNNADPQSGNKVYSYIDICLETNNISCDDVRNFFIEKQNVDLYNKSEKYIETFDFRPFNNTFNLDGNDSIDSIWYLKTKKCPTGGGGNEYYNCTPDYNVGNCVNHESLYYKDSSNGTVDEEYWQNCVFNNYGDYDIDKHKESYLDSQLSSKYCQTYCIEEVSAGFPESAGSFKAGTHFVWGNSTISGSRTCRTKSIDYDQFQSDLSKNNRRVITAYLDYRLEQSKKSRIDNATVQENGCVASTKTQTFTTKRTIKKGTEVKCEGNCDTPIDSKYYDCEVNYTISGNCSTDTCVKTYYKTCKYDITGKKYTAQPVAVTADNLSLYWQGATWCEGETAPKVDVNAKKTAYENAIKEVTATINAMKTCYSWSEADVYKTNPTLTIEYKDGINYSYMGNLPSYTQYDSETSSNCYNVTINRVSGCLGNRCSTTPVYIKKCTNMSMTVSGTTFFSLPDNVYRYVLKDGNKSVMTKPTGERYIDIGYSNFPLSYSIKNGLHGEGIDSAKLNLYYSNLGHTNNSVKLDTIIGNGNLDYGKWKCQFGSYDGSIIGENKIEYRLIDLINPFPDINASNRNTGSNWCAGNGDCSHDNSVVNSYITNNRDAEDYELYQLDPMYTFILTPSDILEIRKYNSRNSYTSYTGSYSNNYYDYKCNKGTGRACISDYFTHLLEITDSYNNPGTCTNKKYRTYNDPSNFETCRYLHSGRKVVVETKLDVSNKYDAPNYSYNSSVSNSSSSSGSSNNLNNSNGSSSSSSMSSYNSSSLIPVHTISNSHTSSVTGIKYKTYEQTNKAWGTNPILSSTVSKEGCAITSSAVIASACDASITPLTIYNTEYKESSPSLQINDVAGECFSCKNILATYDNPLSKQIINGLKQGNTYVIYIKPTHSLFVSGNHYISIVDIKEENGQTFVYIANSYAESGKNGYSIGWKLANEVLNDIHIHGHDATQCTPKQSILNSAKNDNNVCKEGMQKTITSTFIDNECHGSCNVSLPENYVCSKEETTTSPECNDYNEYTPCVVEVKKICKEVICNKVSNTLENNCKEHSIILTTEYVDGECYGNCNSPAPVGYTCGPAGLNTTGCYDNNSKTPCVKKYTKTCTKVVCEGEEEKYNCNNVEPYIITTEYVDGECYGNCNNPTPHGYKCGDATAVIIGCDDNNPNTACIKTYTKECLFTNCN